MIFKKNITAILYSLYIAKTHLLNNKISYLHLNNMDKKIQKQITSMPDFLKFGTFVLLFFFQLECFVFYLSPFYKLSSNKKIIYINKWKESKFTFKNQFIRLFDSLLTLHYFSIEPEQQSISSEKNSIFSINEYSDEIETITIDHCVIGSGPGGSVTAATLAEFKKEVLLIEEGSIFSLTDSIPFSATEMIQKYRSQGVTAILSKPAIAYAEGNCLGGGSEINSGLYHRTPKEILKKWQTDFQLIDSEYEKLEPHFLACEKRLNVNTSPNSHPLAALKLHHGALSLNWKSMEIPRWFSYEATPNENGEHLGVKQSMSETFLKDFIQDGGKILSSTYVNKIIKSKDGWIIKAERKLKNGHYKKINIVTKTVFLGAGTIHTPAILKRSRLSKLAGKSFQIHPTIKVTAKFDEKINSQSQGVPAHQVKEFSPRLSFGCSISSISHLGLSLLDYPTKLKSLSSEWENMAIYYAMISPEGTGKIKIIPGVRAPIVTFKLTKVDYQNLRDGLNKLSQLLINSGAKELLPSVTGIQPWISGQPYTEWNFKNKQMSLMTIHLFSSCPMGENKHSCVVNSVGKLHNHDNFFVCDGSILPTALGVNPQGTIMAFARKNIMHYLKEAN